MPTPQFDISIFVKLNLPPNYRLPKWIAVIQSFLYGLIWRYKVFQAYQGGDIQLQYDSATSYSIGNGVQYNYATYESLINSNIGNIPFQSPNAWVLRNAYFIGATERSAYNGRKLTLEWALNRYFQTSFRQPNDPVSPTPSDIYITTAAIAIPSFVSYNIEAGSSVSFTNGSGFNAVFTGEYIASGTSYEFIVNISTSVYAALGTTDTIRSSVVNAFVNKYCPSGITFSIQTY